MELTGACFDRVFALVDVLRRHDVNHDQRISLFEQIVCGPVECLLASLGEIHCHTDFLHSRHFLLLRVFFDYFSSVRRWQKLEGESGMRLEINSKVLRISIRVLCITSSFEFEPVITDPFLIRVIV